MEEVVLIFATTVAQLISAIGSCPETILLIKAQTLLSTIVVPSEKQTPWPLHSLHV